MDIFTLSAAGFLGAIIYICYSLAQIKQSLARIVTMVEMSEQERHKYNLSIDEPEIYEGVMEAKYSEERDKVSRKNC